MRLIGLAVVLLLGLIPASLTAESQPLKQVPRIGILAAGSTPAVEAFKQGLRDLGYVEGQNVVMEWRLYQGRDDRAHALAAELVRLKLDVLVAMGGSGYDLRLTRYDEKGWRATFYTTGMEHSITSATGTRWERTPWHATQRAACEALVKTEEVGQ